MKQVLNLMTMMDEKMDVYVSEQGRRCLEEGLHELYGNDVKIDGDLIVLHRGGKVSYHGFAGHAKYHPIIHNALFKSSIACLGECPLLNYEVFDRYTDGTVLPYGLVLEKNSHAYLVAFLNINEVSKTLETFQHELYLKGTNASIVKTENLFHHDVNLKDQVIFEHIEETEC